MTKTYEREDGPRAANQVKDPENYFGLVVKRIRADHQKPYNT